MAAHTMFDGRLQIYKRGRVWSCAARVGGQRFRHTTGEQDLDRAKDVAEEWVSRPPRQAPGRQARSQGTNLRRSLRTTTCAKCASWRLPSAGPTYVEGVDIRLKAHILPYFKDKPLSTINREWCSPIASSGARRPSRRRLARTTKATPSRRASPLPAAPCCKRIVIIRQVLKHAEGPGLDSLCAQPRNALHDADEERAARVVLARGIHNAPTRQPAPALKKANGADGKMSTKTCTTSCSSWQNTGLRPDEAWALEFRDVRIERISAPSKPFLSSTCAARQASATARACRMPSILSSNYAGAVSKSWKDEGQERGRN